MKSSLSFTPTGVYLSLHSCFFGLAQSMIPKTTAWLSFHSSPAALLHLALGFPLFFLPFGAQCSAVLFWGDLGSFSWEKKQKLDYRKNYRITYSEWGIWCVKDQKLVRYWSPSFSSIRFHIGELIQHCLVQLQLGVGAVLAQSSRCCSLLALPSLLWMSSFVHLLVWWCCPGNLNSLPGVIFLNWL